MRHMSRPRPLRWCTASIVAIAMLHAVADAAQACEHDRPAVVAATQEHDAHEGHHDTAWFDGAES